MEILYFMIIIEHLNSTIYDSLDIITWRHHLEISRDEKKIYSKTREYGGALFADKEPTCEW